jgi:hypothetical protein
MDGRGQLIQALGALLMGLVLLDVFLTVLYARIGTSILAKHLAAGTWRAFRAFAMLAGRRRRGIVLAYCGPVILLLLVGVWITLLVMGAALVTWPALGKTIVANQGPTPTDFWTACYLAGDAMTTVGASDLSPRTPGIRVFYTFCSVVGLSMITLTLTYFLEVYNALQRRNTLSLKSHLATGETGDAAELVAGVGPQGRFETGYSHLAEMAAEMTDYKESHHFYPVLFYFRFREAYYAFSRLTLVMLDTATLIKSALDDREHGWLKQSAAVNQVWRASMLLGKTLAETFLPGGHEEAPRPDEATQKRWRRRYYAGVRRLRQAGVETLADEVEGAETYVRLRTEWDHCIGRFARYMAHEMAEIDPAGARPEGSDERAEFGARLRSAG